MKLFVSYLKIVFTLFITGLFFRLGFSIKSGFINNSSLFINSFIYGIYFDLAAAAFFGFLSITISFLLSLLNFNNFILQIPITIVGALNLMLLFADAIYFKESGRHITYEIKDSFQNNDAILKIFSEHLFENLIVIIYSISIFKLNIIKLNSTQILKNSLNYIFIFIISVILFRGGITGIPQDPSFAYKFGDAQSAIVSLNGSYSSIYGLLTKNYLVKYEVTTQTDRSIEQSLSELYDTNKLSNTDPNQIKKYNIILLFLEGWPAVYSKSYGSNINATPHFDNFFNHSLTTQMFLAGGHRTSEGLFATLCSFQNPLGSTVAQTQLQTQKYNCLPHELKKLGWSTAFFQGSDKNTSGVGPFAQTLGFSDSFGKQDIPNLKNKPQNKWGVYDKFLYEFTLESLKNFKEPFLLGINTNSTHDLVVPPYSEFANLKYNNDQEKHINILKVADNELFDFVNTVNSLKLNLPTIFVLVADHTSYVESSILNHYRIPFVIYSPQIIKPKILPIAASQKDIAPTMLDILNIPKPNWAGQSILDINRKNFNDIFHYGEFAWIQDDILMLGQLNNIKTKCYLWKSDFLLQKNVPCSSKHLVQWQNGINYTKYSQDLLFNGKTTEFLKFP